MPDRHLQGDRAANAESKNIGLIYMEISEQRSRVICGLFEASLRTDRQKQLAKGGIVYSCPMSKGHPF
jgi:hypothetical protein